MTMLEKKIGKFAALSILLLLWATLITIPITIYAQQEVSYIARQGDSTWNVIPLASSQTVDDFYNYSNDQSNTGLEMSDQTLIFLYKNTNTGQVSLVIINDQPGDGSGGSVDMSLEGIPEFSEILVRDDPDANDTYDFTPPTASIHWEWIAEHDDGIAIGELGENFQIRIIPESLEGIDGLTLLSGNPENPQQIALPSINEPITLTAQVGVEPEACFQVGAEQPMINEAVSFDAGCSNDPDGQLVEYHWSFGDGTTAEGRTVDHEYSEAGTYTVTLRVVDNTGMEAETSREVTVSEAAAIAVRTISTPVALPGSTFRVDVQIEAMRNLDGLGLDENLPVGWKVTPIDNSGATFKKSKTQWLFAEEIKKGEVRCIVYEVTVPETLTSPPDYFTITGAIDSVSPSFHTPVNANVENGDDQIEIHSCLPVIVSLSHLTVQEGEGGTQDVIDLRMSNKVKNAQVKRAREIWVNEERVPKTCGAIMNLEQLKELSAYNITGKPIDRPLPEQDFDEKPQLATRTILTPIAPNLVYLKTENEKALTVRVKIELWADRDYYGLGIEEEVPQNWVVQPVENSSAAFKRSGSTVEWAFTRRIKSGEITTVIYDVVVAKGSQSNFCGECETAFFMGAIDSASPRFKSPINGDSEVELSCCLTIPVAIAKLDTETNTIDPLLSNKITFDQVQAALAFWLEDAEVPGTCGKIIEFEKMKEVISYWINSTSVVSCTEEPCVTKYDC